MMTTPASYDLVSFHTLILALAISVAATLLLRAQKRNSIPLPPSPPALPVVGHFHLLGPLLHHSLSTLSSKYGPLIYLKLGSVPCVLASTPELAREFLKMNELKFTSRKHSAAIDYLTYNNSSFAFAPYDAYWKFIKRLIQTELVGPRTLGQFLPVRTKELRYFLGTIYEKCQSGISVNLTEELLKLTNNTISQMILGIRCSGTNSQADAVGSVIREVSEIFGEFNVSDFIWFCKSIDFQGFQKRFKDIQRRYDGILENIIETREQSRKKERKEGGSGEEKIKDFLDMMLDVYEDPNSEMKVTRNNVKALILDLFTAATDTSATALEWSLAELTNHPTVLKKAKEEIENVVGTARLVQESDIPSLPYIQAIIKETFRLHPPIPVIPRKSTEDATVNGYRIPARTLLFVNMWAIARDPKVWDRPMEYEPERFLGKRGKDSIDVKGHNNELLPFGSGRRGCPGMSLAMLQLPVTLSALIQCFDWRPCGPKGEIVQSVDMSERPGLAVPRANDFICLPAPRLDVPQIISAH